jgi:hypothetical protein
MHTPRLAAGIIAVSALRYSRQQVQFFNPQIQNHGEKTRGADHYSIDGASAYCRHCRIAAIEDHH